MTRRIQSHIDHDDAYDIHLELDETQEIKNTSNISISPQGNDIVLKRSDGKELSLSTLLPPNVIFSGIKGAKFQFNKLPRLLGSGPAQIEYPSDKIDTAIFPLILLQEIGHAVDNGFGNSLYERERGDYDNLRTITGLTGVILVRLTKQIVARVLKRKLRNHYSREETELRRRDERYATNYALRKYRELKNEGWDLSGGLSDSQIHDFFRNSLLTYETDNFSRFPWGDQTYVSMTKRKRGDISEKLSERKNSHNHH